MAKVSCNPLLKWFRGKIGGLVFRRAHNGNDLLWKKHMGDQEKPANWHIDRYPWYRKKSK